MHFWLGVTDNHWFQFLSRSVFDEVNFWQPSPRAPFTSLPEGTPFFFKLKRPHHHVAGGGYFVKFSVLPLSLAWEAFGPKNGASTFEEFDGLIRPLLPDPSIRNPDIGCTVLTEPFFWPQASWIDSPRGWTRQIVVGRKYDSASAEGRHLWADIAERLRYSVSALERVPGVMEPVAAYGEPALVKRRIGQGAFRILVTDAYHRRCAITGEKTLPVLEAAHIRPFFRSGPNTISNGLLLRSDFHKLFDLGYVTVTPDFHVKVSPRIRDEWFNGAAYYRLHGKELATLPETVAERPKSEWLEWHNKEVFQP
jgi:putative restriction endonuclease